MKKAEFTVVVEKDVDGGFVGSVIELPGCYSQGETEKELLENSKEAIELHLSALHAV
jgi:predicted RNase H-like HicB family nuclease